MSKNILFALIIIMGLSSLVISVSDSDSSSVAIKTTHLSSDKLVKCDKRPNITECYDLPTMPTCGYYKKNCPFKECGRDVGNGCWACSDETILYYKNESCDAQEIVNECYDDMCNPDQNGRVEEIFDPVCGIQEGGKIKKTFDNYCEACGKRDFDWYQSGACESDRHNCKSSERNNDCSTKKNSPVCAQAKIEDNSTQYITVSNGCNACSDPAVEHYIQGECGPLSDNSTYCLPNSRPSFCTYEYFPVCAFSLDEAGILQHEISSNACAACANLAVVYHIPGPCVFTCNRSPTIIFECDGTTVQPICGTYEQDGKKVNVSLKNSCIGCYYSPIPKIDSYVDGLCPGDEGIYCKNDAGGFLQGLISPVCGFTTENCSDSSCQTSFSEPLTACADNTTLLFKKGLCPGDEGLSCKPFRDGFIDSENQSYLNGINYGDVCGYTEMGCEDSSCRQNYTNQTIACADEDVLFFTKGTCL